MSSEADEAVRESAGQTGVRVFRSGDAEGMRTAAQRGAVRENQATHPAVTEGFRRLGEAGFGNGATARVLYSSDDMHIAYVWFKSGLPLPLHSHDADCFYQLIAGSMRVGTEELRQGDGVLIPGGVPYTVTPGEAGVEFIEVRPTHDYDTRYRGRTEKYWAKLAETAASRQEAWASEQPPYGLLPR